MSWEVAKLAIFDRQNVTEETWQAQRWEVNLEDGSRGFVSREVLHSLVDYRLNARLEEGRWRIQNFIPGD